MLYAARDSSSPPLQNGHEIRIRPPIGNRTSSLWSKLIQHTFTMTIILLFHKAVVAITMHGKAEPRASGKTKWQFLKRRQGTRTKPEHEI